MSRVLMEESKDVHELMLDNSLIPAFRSETDFLPIFQLWLHAHIRPTTIKGIVKGFDRVE